MGNRKTDDAANHRVYFAAFVGFGGTSQRLETAVA